MIRSTEPAVSVLMTAYNRERYIAGAIESVLASTFADFELIVVDDGSSDGTVEIARHYAREHDRIQVHVNEGNLGDYPNRNRAARLARGRYLKYVDSDDLIYPYGLGYMVEAMEAHPACVLGIARSVPEPDRPFPIEISPEQAYRAHFLGTGLLDYGPTGSILHRARFIASGGFAEVRYLGDQCTWFRLAARHPVLLLPRDLVWWRQHQDQEYALGMKRHGYRQTGFAVQVEALAAPHCPLSPCERAAALRLLQRRHSRNLMRLALIEGKFSDCKHLMKTGDLSFANLIYYGLLRSSP